MEISGANSHLNDEDLLLIIYGDVDFEWEFGIGDVLPRHHQMAHLLHRIRRVRNELADEHLFVGVQRACHNVKNLLRLGLFVKGLEVIKFFG